MGAVLRCIKRLTRHRHGVKFSFFSIVFFVSLNVALLGSAASATAEESISADEVRSLMELVKEQKQQLKAQQKKLDALEKKVSELSSAQQPVAKAGAKPTPGYYDAPRGQQHAKAEAPDEVGMERKPEDDEKPPEIAAELEQGGVLLQKGKMVVTPGFEYTRSSATLVSIEGFSVIPAINIGTFQISKAGRDILTESIAARLGVTNRLEIEGRIPFVYRRDSTTGRPIGGGASTDTTTRQANSGLGDIELGAHYQMNSGQDGWPFLVSNLRFKTITGEGPFEIPVASNGLLTRLPTGTGFYALQPSITAIYPSDPIVYYANLGYLHNFERNFGGTVGKVEPGDSISAAFGMSMSFNDRASFSIGYSHSTVLKSEQNDVSINGDLLQVGSLDLGYAYQLDDRYSLNFNVSAGLTDDAPDTRVGIRVPIKFDVF
ncbi:MAG: transporter [Alphaproteobacteria bacterium]